MHRETLLAKIKVQVDLQFKTKTEAAAKLDMSVTHLNRVIDGEVQRIPPSILEWLGYDEHAVYTYSKIKEL